MVPVTPDRDPATSREAGLQIPQPEFPAKTPAGRRSSTPDAPGGQPDPTPLIPNPAAAARALRDHFLANADRGDHAANDELVAELVRRIRSRQTTRDSTGECNQNITDIQGRPVVVPDNRNDERNAVSRTAAVPVTLAAECVPWVASEARYEQEGGTAMASTPSGSHTMAADSLEVPTAYEPPVVLATFQKRDLVEGLPENLTPHIHAVQNS
jgi:hypothetical protein